MILKYRKEKIYDPDNLKNKVRRMAKITMDRGYQQRLTSNRVLVFLLNLPIIKQTIQLTLVAGNRLLPLIENKQKILK